jgi:hypothetical protein
MFIQGQPNISSYMKRNKIKGITGKQLRDFTDSVGTSKISTTKRMQGAMADDEEDCNDDDDDDEDDTDDSDNR